jgi:putative DNA primase/helicase
MAMFREVSGRFRMTVEEVVSRLKGVKRTGKTWIALCPAHNDHKPSLSVKSGDNGRVLLHCFAGCTHEQICDALGINSHELDSDEIQSAPLTLVKSRRIVATYDYLDETGGLLYQVCRTNPKGFYQRRPDGKGRFINGLAKTRRVLYGLPALLASDTTSTVFIPEGEKDVERLLAQGLVATTNPGGAGKWRDEYSESLSGRHVCVLSDNDEAGRKHCEVVANSLSGTAASVRIVELPNVPDKGDVSDWLDGDGTVEQLTALVVGTPMWKLTNSGNRLKGKGQTARLNEAKSLSPFLPEGANRSC